MVRKTLYCTLTASLLLVGASTADAQFASPIRFNVNAGAATPMGDFGDRNFGGADLGFHIGAGLELRAPLMPIGLRFDGAFDRLGFEADDGVGGTFTGDWSIWSLTANAVLSPMVSPLYFIGGVGFYSTKPSANIDGGSLSLNSQTDFGFNLGAGLQLPLTGFSTFIEARYHRISADWQNDFGIDNISYVPIVFGIRF